MSKEYPLYPELSAEGAEEAQKIIDLFKLKMQKVCEETLSTIYTDIAVYIETDSWTNFRNQLMDGFRDYNNSKIQAKYDFKAIRQQLLKEFRQEIIKDLNADIVEENEQLKQTIEMLQRLRQ